MFGELNIDRLSSEELRSRQFWRAMLAELLGTLVLVSAVLGASMPGPGEAPGGPLYPAVAVGVVIVALAHCFGEISGAQVSVSQSYFDFKKLFFYCISDLFLTETLCWWQHISCQRWKKY